MLLLLLNNSLDKFGVFGYDQFAHRLNDLVWDFWLKSPLILSHIQWEITLVYLVVTFNKLARFMDLKSKATWKKHLGNNMVKEQSRKCGSLWDYKVISSITEDKLVGLAISFPLPCLFFPKLPIWLLQKLNQEYMINLDEYYTEDDYTYREIYRLSFHLTMVPV